MTWEFLKRRRRWQKHGKSKAENDWVNSGKTAQKRISKRRGNRIHAGTQNMRLIYQKLIRHLVSWLQTMNLKSSFLLSKSNRNLKCSLSALNKFSKFQLKITVPYRSCQSVSPCPRCSQESEQPIYLVTKPSHPAGEESWQEEAASLSIKSKMMGSALPLTGASKPLSASGSQSEKWVHKNCEIQMIENRVTQCPGHSTTLNVTERTNEPRQLGATGILLCTKQRYGKG